MIQLETNLQNVQLAADQWRALNQPTIIQTSTPSITSGATLANQPMLDAYGNTVYAQTPVATTIPTSNTTIIQPPPAAYGYGYGSPYYHDHHSDVVGDLLLWNAIGNSFGGGGRYSETNHYHHYYPTSSSSSSSHHYYPSSTSSSSSSSSGKRSGWGRS